MVILKGNVKGNDLYLIKKKTDEKITLLEDLNKLPLILREEGSAARMTSENFINKNEITPIQTLVLTSNEAVKQGVLAGLGYSLMPIIGLKSELINDELEIIPFDGLPINTQWNLIWQKEKQLSPIASKFVEYLKENKAEIIKKNFEWYENYTP